MDFSIFNGVTLEKVPIKLINLITNRGGKKISLHDIIGNSRSDSLDKSGSPSNGEKLTLLVRKLRCNLG